jgi:RNA polymerase sigma-70 factor (ECF subfamily)
MSVFHPKQVARDNPEGDVLGKENAEMVSQVMDRLPPRYRLCLLLREYEELSCEEIAQILGTTRGAVKSLLFRAREEFREIYKAIDTPAPPSAARPPAGTRRRGGME